MQTILSMPRTRLVWCYLCPMRTSIALTLITLLLTGCSSDQLYASGRNAQRAECLKLSDGTSRDRCLKDADTPHDDYKKAAEAARK